MNPEYIIDKILNTKGILGFLKSDHVPDGENVIIKFQVDEFIPSTEKEFNNLLILNMFLNADATEIRSLSSKYDGRHTDAIMDILWKNYNLDAAYWSDVIIPKNLNIVGLGNTRVELYIYDKEGNFIYESK